MPKGQVNLQDSFLNLVRREGNETDVVLVSGERLRGAVTGFDNFTVILREGKSTRLIYKHAIAHIVAGDAVTASSKRGSDAKTTGHSKDNAFNPIDVSVVDLKDAPAPTS